jgi:hypothetical protein
MATEKPLSIEEHPDLTALRLRYERAAETPVAQLVALRGDLAVGRRPPQLHHADGEQPDHRHRAGPAGGRVRLRVRPNPRPDLDGAGHRRVADHLAVRRPGFTTTSTVLSNVRVGAAVVVLGLAATAAGLTRLTRQRRAA